MAEGAFRNAAEKAGLRVKVDSAGTAAYHIAEPPDPRAIATAARYGVDISGLRGRQLADEDFERFTHILAMDTANMAGISARTPRQATAQVGLLLDILEGQADSCVADPYYGNDDDFEKCWTVINKAVDTLIGQLVSQDRGEPRIKQTIEQ